MRGLQKSRRVTWASDVNLCQVRLFLSEESPSEVGFGAQDHLQAKASGLPHSTGTAPDDILPPGFEGGHPTGISPIKVSDVPVIKWRSPPRYVVNLTWQVVAGEESTEVEVQNQREMRVFEAVYPRPSAIPLNPAFTADVEDSRYNDSQIPLIPILPIEDEDAADTPFDSAESFSVSMISQPQPFAPGVPPLSTNLNASGTLHNERVGGDQLGVEPDAVAAAFAAINKGMEQGGMIDQDLLIKILSNPKLVEKLVTDYGSASSTQNISKPAASFVPSSDRSPWPVSLSDPSHLHMSRIEPSVPPPLVATSSGSFYSQPNGISSASRTNAQVPLPGVLASSGLSSTGNPPVKDLNYYKSLIQQHGGERQENPQQYGNRYGHQMGGNQDLVNQKPRDTKHKIMNPSSQHDPFSQQMSTMTHRPSKKTACIYFKTSRGCLHGVNCAYQHDTSSQQKSSNTMQEAQSAKRMKMDREISS